MSTTKKNILIYSLIGVFAAICIACFCCIKFIKFGNKSITINCDDSVTLNIGESYPLEIECSDSEAHLEFSTENSDIIKIVDQEITALSSGIAYVKVKAVHNDISGSKNIRVVVENNDIDLNISLAAETDLYLIDKMYNKAAADGFNNAVYYSTNDNVDFILSNSDVVSVSKAYKKITAKKEGSVTITFYSKENPTIKSSHIINVKSVAPTFTLTSKSKITLEVGETEKFSFNISPVYYTGSVEITTKVENEEIATLNNGIISAVKAGNTKISVYMNGELAEEIEVVVNAKYVPSYTLRIVPFKNCSFDNNTIHANKKSFTVKIYIENEKGEIVDSLFTISGAEYNVVMGKYFFNVSSNTSFVVTSEALGINETITIILN